jgi:hypothetical protein
VRNRRFGAGWLASQTLPKLENVRKTSTIHSLLSSAVEKALDVETATWKGDESIAIYERL